MLNPYFEDEIKDMNENMQNLPDAILNPKQVTNYFRAIKALEDENKSFDENADDEIQRISDWRDKKKEVNTNNIDRLKSTLLSYYRIEREKDEGFKLQTPYGHVSDRKTPKKWNYQDEEAAIKSLEDNGEDDLIEVTKTLKKKPLKKSAQIVNGKVITSNGTPVNGIEIEPQGRSITLKMEDD